MIRAGRSVCLTRLPIAALRSNASLSLGHTLPRGHNTKLISSLFSTLVSSHTKGSAQSALSRKIRQLGKERRWLDVVKVVDRAAIPLSSANYSAAINATTLSNQWEASVLLLEEMRSQGHTPSRSTCNFLLNGCTRSRQPELAGRVCKTMVDSGMIPKTIPFNYHTETTGYYVNETDDESGMDVVVLPRPLEADAQRGDWQYGMHLCTKSKGGHWKRLSKAQIALVEEIQQLGKEKKWRGVLKALEHATVSPSSIIYTAAIHAMLASKQWLPAIHLFDEMRQKGIMPSAYTYGALLKVCDAAGEYERVLGYFEEMTAASIEPTPVCYRAAIHAHLQLGDGKSGAHTYDEMLAKGMFPRIGLLNSLIEACRKEGDGYGALHYFRAIKKNRLTPNLASYTLVLNAVREGVADSASLIKEIEDEAMKQGKRGVFLDAQNSI